MNWNESGKLSLALVTAYQRTGALVLSQTEVFVYVMRYTGMDVSSTTTLPKNHVRGNQVLTYELKNGSEVWTVIPEWVAEKLATVPHDSDRYFFWGTGDGAVASRAGKWFRRIRKLLDLAGLSHRSPHNFRHHFAVEHLSTARRWKMFPGSWATTIFRSPFGSYAAWLIQRQMRLEQHQRRLWSSDPLHQRMDAESTGKRALPASTFLNSWEIGLDCRMQILTDPEVRASRRPQRLPDLPISPA